MPRAYIEMILSSKPVNRLCPLATILGSKLPCRSRGVSSSSSPKSPFSTLRPLPLRLFPLCCPAGSCFSYPRWSVSSACSARSRIAFVSCFSRPFSPMMSSGFLYPASIWSISALSIAIGADSPLPMVGYTVPYTAPNELECPLDHAITDGRDRQDSDLGAAVLRYLFLPYRHGPIRLLDQFVLYPLEKSLRSALFDRVEGDPVDSRGPIVLLRHL